MTNEYRCVIMLTDVNNMSDDKLYSASAVAKMLGFSKHRLNYYIHQGILPAQNISSNPSKPTYVITHRDFERFTAYLTGDLELF